MFVLKQIYDEKKGIDSPEKKKIAQIIGNIHLLMSGVHQHMPDLKEPREEELIIIIMKSILVT